MRNLNFGCAVGVIAVAIVASAPALAQDTTSSIAGTVTSGGQPVPGATVSIIHVPSGTRSTVTTNSSGSFNANGLRIGGPYTVEVVASGYADSSVTDIETVAGQAFTLPIELADRVQRDRRAAAGKAIGVEAEIVGDRHAVDGEAVVACVLASETDRAAAAGGIVEAGERIAAAEIADVAVDGGDLGDVGAGQQRHGSL